MVSNYQMIREQDPHVEYYHTEASGNGKTTFAVWSPKAPKGKLPVVLFQSGYGANSDSHYLYLQRIAAEGFLVVAPDRSDDQFCGLCGIIGFLSFVSCSALAVDGSNLKLALEYIKDPKNQWMDRADLNKITMAGFSMGASEALHATTRFPGETKAVMFISPSILAPVGNIINWNCCMQPCFGGSCRVCSDTPVGYCGQGAAVRAITVPTLIVTAENDTLAGGAYRAADLLGDKAVLVTLKESAIDLSTPVTRATSYWGPMLSMGCCVASPFHGIIRHFAIADDTAGSTSDPTVAFLKQVYTGVPMVGTETFVNGKLNSRAELGCCFPFPLFKSCFES